MPYTSGAPSLFEACAPSIPPRIGGWEYVNTRSKPPPSSRVAFRACAQKSTMFSTRDALSLFEYSRTGTRTIRTPPCSSW